MSAIHARKVAEAILAGHRLASEIATAAGVSKGYVLKETARLEKAGKVTVHAVRLPARNILAQAFAPTPLLTNRPDPQRVKLPKHTELMRLFFSREFSK